ncbi:MAG TPA: fumarylacetoacetase [Acetobacteraceae bacterium]|nr:fumarylacetoacetase [Acetobacteraceae bacterium]
MGDEGAGAGRCARLDATHDPRRSTWVESADGHPDFPIQNLPLGVFSPPGGTPRAGIAIGEEIFDLRAAAAAGLFTGEAASAASAAEGASLNALMALGAGPRRAIRARVSDLLDADGSERLRVQALPGLIHPAHRCTLHLPAAIGDYTDFYAGIHHATHVGALLRPESPLPPNYKYSPIAYHGRASTVVVSGTGFRRPSGQRKPRGEDAPRFGPSQNLDFELELGIWIGPGNALGAPVPIAEAATRVAGFCLLNDWSARDIQGWEYQPLGPFLGKNFCTTVSPWVVTPEALQPFRCIAWPRGEDPPPLAYLADDADQRKGGLDIALEVSLSTLSMRDRGLRPERIALSTTRHLYWTVAQLVAHHASGGCRLRPGDLFGTGTISGPEPASFGSLLEITGGGRKPLALASGETRRFLEDGDEVVLSARAVREGFVSIGFGACTGRVMPAPR